MTNEMSTLVLPPPMLPSQPPYTPINQGVPKELRRCPGAPRRRTLFMPLSRCTKRDLDELDTEKPSEFSSLTVDEVLKIIDAQVQILELEARQFKEAAKLWRECASVTLRDRTPDWKVRASRALRAQLEERFGTLEPDVEASLRAHELEHETELKSLD